MVYISGMKVNVLVSELIKQGFEISKEWRSRLLEIHKFKKGKMDIHFYFNMFPGKSTILFIDVMGADCNGKDLTIGNIMEIERSLNGDN